MTRKKSRAGHSSPSSQMVIITSSSILQLNNSFSNSLDQLLRPMSRDVAYYTI